MGDHLPSSSTSMQAEDGPEIKLSGPKSGVRSVQAPPALAESSWSFDTTESLPPLLSSKNTNNKNNNGKIHSFSSQDVRGIFRAEAGKSDIQPVVTNSTSGTSSSGVMSGSSHFLNTSGSFSSSFGASSSSLHSRVPRLFPFTSPPSPPPPQLFSLPPSFPLSRSIVTTVPPAFSTDRLRTLPSKQIHTSGKKSPPTVVKSSPPIFREVYPGLGSIETEGSAPDALLEAVTSLKAVGQSEDDDDNPQLFHQHHLHRDPPKILDEDQTGTIGETGGANHDDIHDEDESNKNKSAVLPQDNVRGIFRSPPSLSATRDHADRDITHIAPIVTATTSESRTFSLESIDDDDIPPPTPLSFMELQFDALDSKDELFGDEKQYEQYLQGLEEGDGIKGTVSPNLLAKDDEKPRATFSPQDHSDDSPSDPVARKIAQFSDPSIRDKRWTVVGRNFSSSAPQGVDSKKQKKKEVNATNTDETVGQNSKNTTRLPMLELCETDLAPAPFHYMEDSARKSGDDGAVPALQQHNQRSDTTSSLPPPGIQYMQFSPKEKASDKILHQEQRNDTMGKTFPNLEVHCLSENHPVPLHYIDAETPSPQQNDEWVDFQSDVFPSSFRMENNSKLGLHDASNAIENTTGGRFVTMLHKEKRDSSSTGSFILHGPDDGSKSDRSDGHPWDSNQSSAVLTDEPRARGSGSDESEEATNARLAVAKPVNTLSEGDGDIPLYEAIEYDPDAKKVPVYYNRKYQCYSVVALLVIGVIVAVSVVYGTRKAVDDGIQYVPPDATFPPTPSPTSSRFFTGIAEEIESNVLRRGATFQNMTKKDPRMLALNWLLYDDSKQLEVSDETLHQRYILALLAFSLDSLAWKHCGEGSSLDDKPGMCTVSHDVFGDDPVAWLSGSDECDWYGVMCDPDGFIYSLELRNNTMIGEIVPEIAGLGSSLKVIEFSWNCLYGTLPPEMGALSSLEQLTLKKNAFSGIFPDAMYNLTSLVHLDIGFQYANDRSCVRSNGTMAQTLYSMGNPDYGPNNGISGTFLDDRIGKFHNLQELAIGSNSFLGPISPEISKLKNLVQLHASSNFFSQNLPNEITELTNLTDLWLEQNYLTGGIPEEIDRMESLVQFSIWWNDGMNGTIPDSLYNLTKLTHLHLLRNQFSGTISTRIGNLKSLHYLALGDNEFSGTLPSEIGLCEDLETLIVNGNNITESVPDEVCELRSKNLCSTDSFFECMKADCLPDNTTLTPLLECDCCKICCDGSTGQCVEME